MEATLNIEEAAAKLGVSTDELFEQSFKMFGLMFGTGGAQADHAWWKKWGTVPIYVTKFVKRAERRENAPTIDA